MKWAIYYTCVRGERERGSRREYRVGLVVWVDLDLGS